MASRRLVRQAAVQLLYARFASPKDQGGPEFWSLVNDKAALIFDRTRVKVLIHFQQGREALTEKLQRALTECAAAILAADPTEKLARDLKTFSAREHLWAENCGNLHRLTKADTGGWRHELQKLLPGVDELRQNRVEILKRIEGFPPAQYEKFTDILGKLDKYDARARMVHFPENYPEQRDLDHLHRLTGEMKELEKEAIELADHVETEVTTIDEAINTASANFDIERISKVDLAILRLASWEIMKLPDLDAAISINEAIDLARSFSGEESASYVNGVLDKISKA
ncbi:MAG: transcription antitermination factor NusB [Akkermansiaceae bacterium]|nr:transcription antitermination factor NusB [Akkermansiaceae bacterium]